MDRGGDPDMENKKRRSLYSYMTRGIAPRIMTVIMVIFMPACLMAIITAVIVMNRSAGQIMDSLQRELNLNMNTMEMHMQSVEGEMDDFVSAYISELGGKNVKSPVILDYDMLSKLEKILNKTTLPGYAYLYNVKSGSVYIKYQLLNYTVSKQERWKSNIRQVAENTENSDFTLIPIDTEDYIARTYSYQNYRVGFLFNLPACISRQLSDIYEDGRMYYLGNAVTELGSDGAVNRVDDTWESLNKSSMSTKSIMWSSQELELKVCMRFHNFLAVRMLPYGNWILLGVSLLCLLLIPFLWRILKIEIIRPLGQLVYGMEELGKNDLAYRIDDHTIRNSEEIQFLFDSFDKMAAEIQLSKDKDMKMLRAELDNLRLQVNPHMILNSLNMIYSLAQTKNYTCIQDYTLYLVDYFRYVLRKNDDFVPVKQELEFIQSYIEIQKIRFPNAFSWVYSIDEECLNALIPPLLIENFIENSMKYALIPGQSIEILLNVRLDKESNTLIISVCDTGRGIREDILERLREGKIYVDKNGNKHIGIWNCMRRIEVFYGAKSDLSIVSTRDEGTQIFLKIPYLEVEANETADRG